MIADDPRRDLGEIACPAVVLWGARDPQLPLDDAFEYTRRLGAKLRVVADCGHLVIVERPAACLDALAELAGWIRLDGVLDREELPLEAEALRQPLRERLHAEPLGRVVTARDEVDPELACRLQARLLRLAREVEVVALVRRADQLAARAARADRDALDPLRAMREDERVAVEQPRDAADELLDADRLGSRPPWPTSPNGRSGSTPSASASSALLPISGCASSAR